MKKIITILLSLIITLSLFIFIGVISSMNMIVNTIKEVYTEEKITSDILDGIQSQIPDLNSDILVNVQEKIYRSPEMTKITNKFVDALMHDIHYNTVTNIDLKKEISSLTDNIIIQYNLNSIYSELIKKEVNKIDYNKIYISILSNIKKDDISSLINFYNALSTDIVKIGLCALVIVNTLIIVLINCNIKVLIILSIPYYLNSLIYSIILPIIIENIEFSLTNKYLGKTAAISSTAYCNTGFYALYVAVLFTFIYIIIKKVSLIKN